MDTKQKYTLADAADMARDLSRGNTWEYAIAHASYVTKLSRDAIAARIDRNYNDWCAQYGYDYT